MIFELVLFLRLSCVIKVEQITAEYKALALQYHPDKNEGDKEAEVKFQQLKVSRGCIVGVRVSRSDAKEN